MKKLIESEKININSQYDVRMMYLSGLAIIFVVFGHMSGVPTGIFTFDEWFPFYSFHMPLFLFISGYFYKEKNDQEIGRFLLKKTKNLLLPYYICNLIFLVLQTGLSKLGFSIGHTFSFYNWIVWPWVHTQPYTFAIPSWYLIAFFICCVVYSSLRKLFLLIIKASAVKEYLLLLLLLLIGFTAVFIHKQYNAGDTATVYLRSAVMLFFIQLGFIYKKILEKHDTMRNIPYFAILFGLRFITILIAIAKGGKLTFGLFELKDFGNTGISFYVAGILGIALWLRIATLLASYPKKITILAIIGNNSKYIMLFHVFGFFILNTIWFGLTHIISLLEFDKEQFFSQIYYCASGIPQISLVYLVFGIGFSLLLVLLIEKIKIIFHSIE